jgi:hypothetical protein
MSFVTQATETLGSWGYLLAIGIAFVCSAGFFGWVDYANRRDIRAGKVKDFGHSGAGPAIAFLLSFVVLSALLAIGWSIASK